MAFQPTWAKCSPCELIGLDSSRRPSVRLSVFASVHFQNMNIPETSRPIAIKCYLKHHWGGGKGCIRFEPDWIEILVSMATESSNRVIISNGENVTPLAPSFLIGSSFLQMTRTTI